MIDHIGWVQLGISSSQMSWLIFTEILATFVVPTLGALIYYLRIERAPLPKEFGKSEIIRKAS